MKREEVNVPAHIASQALFDRMCDDVPSFWTRDSVYEGAETHLKKMLYQAMKAMYEEAQKCTNTQ